MRKKEKKRSVMSSLYYVIRNAWENNRTIIWLIMLQGTATFVAPLISIYIPNIVLQGATGVIGITEMLVLVIGLSVLLAIVSFASTYISHIMDSSLINHRIFYMKEILSKWMSTDYQNIESSYGQNKFQEVNGILFNDNAGAYGMLNTLGALVASVVGIVTYAGIIFMLSPYVVIILLLTSVFHFCILRNITKYEYDQRQNWTPLERKIHYLLNKLSDYKISKDVKLYSMKGWLLGILESLIRERILWFVKIAKHSYIEAVSDALILLVRDGVSYLFVIRSILNHDLQIAEFVLYIGVIGGFSGIINSIIEQTGVIVRTGHDVNTIRDFLEMPDIRNTNRSQPDEGVRRDAVPYDNGDAISIEFQNVSFRYSENMPFVLKNLSFSIRPGEKVALVGENGAGKTTLVKLLCGFYTPTEGKILLNGFSMDCWKQEDIYSLFSVAFQDSFILPLSVAQNIAMTSEEKVDGGKVRSCLDKVGLLHKFPDLNRSLTKTLDPTGIELSGGESQKIILARAMYKPFKGLVLDEPTSALDPIAEASLYRQYHEISKDRTTVFISHRLASTRFCHKIFLLDEGRIVETGSHDELMSQNGKYKELFDIQSQYYKEKRVDDEDR